MRYWVLVFQFLFFLLRAQQEMKTYSWGVNYFTNAVLSKVSIPATMRFPILQAQACDTYSAVIDAGNNLYYWGNDDYLLPTIILQQVHRISCAPPHMSVLFMNRTLIRYTITLGNETNAVETNNAGTGVPVTWQQSQRFQVPFNVRDFGLDGLYLLHFFLDDRQQVHRHTFAFVRIASQVQQIAIGRGQRLALFINGTVGSHGEDACSCTEWSSSGFALIPRLTGCTQIGISYRSFVAVCDKRVYQGGYFGNKHYVLGKSADEVDDEVPLRVAGSIAHYRQETSYILYGSSVYALGSNSGIFI